MRALAAIFRDLAEHGGGFAGRNGGDEFCIALLDRTKDAAVVVAEHARATVEAMDFDAALGDGGAAGRDGATRRVAGHDGAAGLRISVSIGVAHFPVDVPGSLTGAAERLLEIADAQMYEAKRGGRNRVEFLRAGAARPIDGDPGEGPIRRR